MKTIIKIIIALFFSLIGILYLFIPSSKLGGDHLPWHIVWIFVSHNLISYIIILIPIIFIFKWLDKNIK